MWMLNYASEHILHCLRVCLFRLCLVSLFVCSLPVLFCSLFLSRVLVFKPSCAKSRYSFVTAKPADSSCLCITHFIIYQIVVADPFSCSDCQPVYWPLPWLNKVSSLFLRLSELCARDSVLLGRWPPVLNILCHRVSSLAWTPQSRRLANQVLTEQWGDIDSGTWGPWRVVLLQRKCMLSVSVSSQRKQPLAHTTNYKGLFILWLYVCDSGKLQCLYYILPICIQSFPAAFFVSSQSLFLRSQLLWKGLQASRIQFIFGKTMKFISF